MKTQPAIEIDRPTIVLISGHDMGQGFHDFDYHRPNSMGFALRNAQWVPTPLILADTDRWQRFFEASPTEFDAIPMVEWSTDARQQQFLYLGTHNPSWRLFIDGELIVPTPPPAGMRMVDEGMTMRPIGIHRGDGRSHACRLMFTSPAPRMRRFSLELIGVTFGGVQVPKGVRFGPTP